MNRPVCLGVCCIVLIMLCFSGHYCRAEDQIIGEVRAVEGTAKFKPSGELEFTEAEKGDQVSVDNAYLTEEESKLLLGFDDNSHHSLGRDSSVYINDFGEEGRTTYYHGHVAKGYVRFLKRLRDTEPPSAYVVTTPTAVISVKPHKDKADFIVQVHNDYQTDVTVLFGKLTVENILDDVKEERTLRSCQRVFIDAGKAPSKAYWVSEKTMERLLERTTIKGTLSEETPQCKKAEKECPCPWGYGQDTDGTCKPCAFFAGALYDPEKCECVCPCPKGTFPNPIDGRCLPACPTQAPVLRSSLSPPDPNVLPHEGCGYCSCCDNGLGCYLSFWGDPSCSSPACGHCGPPIAIWPPIITPADPFGLYPCAKCCDCDLHLAIVGGPCGLNAAAFPTAGSCGPTAKCISRAECLANGGYFVRTDWRVFARPCWVCQRDQPIVAFKAMAAAGGACGPCEKMSYKTGARECVPITDGTPCFSEEADCGECKGGKCEKLQECPEGQKYDSKCECVDKPEDGEPPQQEAPPAPPEEKECETNSQCSKETAGKKPCCREGQCVKYQRCPDGKYRCRCDEAQPPSEPPRETPPPAPRPRPADCGKCEERVSGTCVKCWRLDKKCYQGRCVDTLPDCGPCKVRRGSRCVSCAELGLRCDRRGRCVRGSVRCGPCQEKRNGQCYSCAQLEKKCVNGRCVRRSAQCGPCQERRGDSCVSCRKAGKTCVNGRCVKLRFPSPGSQDNGPTQTPQGGPSVYPGVQIKPGGRIQVDPEKLRETLR